MLWNVLVSDKLWVNKWYLTYRVFFKCKKEEEETISNLDLSDKIWQNKNARQI